MSHVSPQRYQKYLESMRRVERNFYVHLIMLKWEKYLVASSTIFKWEKYFIASPTNIQMEKIFNSLFHPYSTFHVF
jgi:hypothetical protein